MAGIPVADIAEAAQLSRTSVYRSKTMVVEFAQSLDESSHYFQTVAITEAFLMRMVLSLSLDCHAPLERIQRFAESVLSEHLSICRISGMIREAADRAQQFDDYIPLDPSIRVPMMRSINTILLSSRELMQNQLIFTYWKKPVTAATIPGNCTWMTGKNMGLI